VIRNNRAWFLILAAILWAMLDCPFSAQGGINDPIDGHTRPPGWYKDYPEKCIIGCFIELDNMVYREDVELAGLPYQLHYSSWRVPSNRAPYMLDIPIRNPAESNDAPISVQVTIDVADVQQSYSHGQTNYSYGNMGDIEITLHPSYGAAAYLQEQAAITSDQIPENIVYQWDGRDAVGNILFGVYKGQVAIRSTYVTYTDGPAILAIDTGSAPPGSSDSIPPPGSYDPPMSPAVAGQGPGYCPPNYQNPSPRSGSGVPTGGGVSASISRIPHYYNMTRTYSVDLGTVWATNFGLGGWTLSPHHYYDVKGQTLFLGTGDHVAAAPIGAPACVFGGLTITGQTINIVSGDGREMYVFGTNGSHLRTLDTLSGTTNYIFTYNASGLLSSIADVNGLTTSIERDAQGSPTAIVSPYGIRTEMSLSADGYLEKVVTSIGGTNIYYYAPGGLMTNYITRRGYTYTVHYDEEGRVTFTTNYEGGVVNVSRTNYYPSYKLDNASSPGRVETHYYEFLPNGFRQRTISNALFVVSRTLNNYDNTLETNWLANGLVITTKKAADPRFGLQAPYVSEVLLDLPSGLRWSGGVSRIVGLANTNDLLSLTQQVYSININGRLFESTYQSAGRTVSNRTAEGRWRQVTLDEMGRPTKLEVPGLYDIDAVYDEDGRLASITQGAGAEQRALWLNYSADGWLASLSNNLGRTVQLYSDPAGRATNIIRPDSQVIGLRYNPSDLVTGVTPPGRPEHTMDYTGMGLFKLYSAPDVGQPTNLVFTYNQAREWTSICYPADRVVTATYNEVGLPQSLTWPEDKINFSFNTNGVLTGIASTSGVSWAYGFDGPLLTNAYLTGPVTGRIGITYNTDLHPCVVTINGTVSIPYTYDNDLLITGAGDMELRRDAQNGFLTNTVLGQVSDYRSFNGFGERSSYSAYFSATSVYSVVHSSDLMGRITSRVEAVLGVTNRYDYYYDEVGRLTQVNTNGATYSQYQYDPNGNRTNAVVAAAVSAAQYDAQDRLLTYGSATYQYNAWGSLTNRSVGGTNTAYRYDTRGSLLEVREGTNVILYTVDPMGRRIAEKRNGSVVQRLVYQDFLKPAAEISADGSILAYFVYATRVNVPDYIVKTGRTYRIITDHLGSVRLVVDAETGGIAQRLDYDEFGRVTQDSNTGFQPFGFAGGLYDHDTGLVRFGFRDYDSGIGRWLSKDPVGLSGGLHLYVFVGNNPVNYIDPWGLVVYNDSSRTIWIKPETGPKATQALPIPPGGCWPGAQDGIADPGAHPGEVYKNVTGVDLRVNEDGSVDWTTDPSGVGDWTKQFGGMVWPGKRGGGWKDSDWQKWLHERKPDGDYGWDKLFDASKPKPDPEDCKK